MSKKAFITLRWHSVPGQIEVRPTKGKTDTWILLIGDGVKELKIGLLISKKISQCKIDYAEKSLF